MRKHIKAKCCFASVLLAAVGALASAAQDVGPAMSPAAPPKKIFAHYMGCCPVASGPQAYHKGEDPKTLRHDSPDKAAQRGGHGRNWDLVPYGMKLSAEESADLEIRRAMRIGIDGFAVDAWAGNQDARRSVDALFRVAESNDYPFEITLCIDPMCGGDIVASVRELIEKHGKSPKLARRNGKPLVFGYQSWIPSLKYLQKQKPGLTKEETARLRTSPEGWEIMGQAFRDAEKQIGQPIYWHYCLDAFFHGVDRKLVDVDAMVRSTGVLARHVSAVGSFGWLGPNTGEIAAAVKAAGAEWSCPIGFYQKENIPYETYAGKGLDWMCDGWKRVRETDATLLQFSTWNDYGENSNIAPAYNTRYALYDLTGFFIEWWKKGKEPATDRDKLYVISRKYPPNVKVFPFQQGPYLEGAIEIASILTAPAKIRLPGRDAEYDAPAGFFRKQFPITPGPVIAEIVRDGKTVVRIESPEPITDRPFREDNAMTCWSTEEERHWKEDFGDTPMFCWSEYGDADKDGLPNWFEMYWFSKERGFKPSVSDAPDEMLDGPKQHPVTRWGDMSTATLVDPKADPDADGKSNLDEYLNRTDPTVANAGSEPKQATQP